MNIKHPNHNLLSRVSTEYDVSLVLADLGYVWSFFCQVMSFNARLSICHFHANSSISLVNTQPVSNEDVAFKDCCRLQRSLLLLQSDKASTVAAWIRAWYCISNCNRWDEGRRFLILNKRWLSLWWSLAFDQSSTTNIPSNLFLLNLTMNHYFMADALPRLCQPSAS